MTEIFDHIPHAVSCGMRGLMHVLVAVFVTKSLIRKGSFHLYECNGLVEIWSPSGDVGAIANHANDSMKRVTKYLFP